MDPIYRTLSESPQHVDPVCILTVYTVPRQQDPALRTSVILWGNGKKDTTGGINCGNGWMSGWMKKRNPGCRTPTWVQQRPINLIFLQRATGTWKVRDSPPLRENHLILHARNSPPCLKAYICVKNLRKLKMQELQVLKEGPFFLFYIVGLGATPNRECWCRNIQRTTEFFCAVPP